MVVEAVLERNHGGRKMMCCLLNVVTGLIGKGRNCFILVISNQHVSKARAASNQEIGVTVILGRMNFLKVLV